MNDEQKIQGASVVSASKKMSKKRRINLFSLIIVVLLVLGYGSAYYFYGKYSVVKKSLPPKEELVSFWVEKLGKLMILPETEAPEVVTIIDKSKLDNQLFFANAQNGDKFFVYKIAKKAIIYRPSTNKIVEVGPIIDIPPSSTSNTTSKTDTKTTEKK